MPKNAQATLSNRYNHIHIFYIFVKHTLNDNTHSNIILFLDIRIILTYTSKLIYNIYNIIVNISDLKSIACKRNVYESFYKE